MATYVNDLRLKEIATGDEAGTWGTSTNTNLELIGEALGYGTQQVFSSDADATTTVADGASDPARAMYFKITSAGNLTATRTCTIAPNTVSRVMFIENATSGSQSINISQGSGANVTIATGKTAVVYLDGAGSGAAVVDAMALVDPGVTDTLAEVLTAGNTSSGTNIELTTTDKVQFRDSAIYLNSSTDGQLDIVADTEVQIAATTIDINGNVDISGTAGVGGVLTANAGVKVDNITIDGTEIDLSSGDLTLDVAGDIILDAAGRDIKFLQAGTQYLSIFNDVSNNAIINSVISDKDISFTGNDGGSTITALTLDMSQAGRATFNEGIVLKSSSAGDFGVNINTASGDSMKLQVTDTGSGGAANGIISVSDGDLTLDVSGDIHLDADGGDVNFKDGGTTYGFMAKSSNDLLLGNVISDGDVLIRGNDGGSNITALTLDMSDAGAATFNGEVFIPEKLTHTGDTDTHFKFAGANDIRIVAGGVDHVAFDGTIVFNQSAADMDLRVESTGNQNMLFIDSGNDVVNIGGTTSQTGDVLSIHGSGTNTVARMYNTNAGGDGSIFIFQKDSSSPADQDVLGDIRFQGNDDGGTMTQFSRIRGVSADVTNGTEDGEMHFEVVHNGTTREVLQLGSSIVFNEAGQDIDFRVESNGNANMLLVDAGNDAVVVGHSASIQSAGEAHELQVYDTNFSLISAATFRNGSDGATVTLGHSRSGTIGTQTVLQDDDIMGQVLFVGSDGTDFANVGAFVRASVDGTPGANDMPGRLTFATTADGANSATERMRITSAGFVGINTNAPQRELHVSNSSSGATSTSNSVAVIESNDNTEFSLLGGSSSVLAINFGHSGDNNDGYIAYNTTSGSEAMSFFVNGGTDSLYLSSGDIVVNNGSADTNFRVESNSNANMLVVDASADRVSVGSDGSGAAVSSYALSATGSVPFVAASNSTASTETYGAVAVYRTKGSNSEGTGISFQLNDDAGNVTEYSYIGTSIKDAANGSEDGAFLIMNTVAASTRQESARFGRDETVFNEGSRDLDFRVESDGNANMLFVDAGNNRLLIGTNTGSAVSSTCNTMHVAGGSSDAVTPVMMISDADGSVEGNSTILECLFSGDNTFSSAMYVKFTDAGGTQGSISGTGDGTVTYNTSSDERLKQNIQDTDSKWNLVKSLQVRDYEWKKSGKQETGFIAQELHDKWEQPVKVGGEDVEVDPWSVDYGKLTPILTKALQEAMEKIEALEAKITALEAN